jgi:hypothetical protein
MAIGPRVLRTGLHSAVGLCLVVALVHVAVVFLAVAPSNSFSRRYGQQINAWVYPLFEQNWRLFAPNPDSFNRQILARTARTAPDGSMRVSPWLDLTAVDRAAVKHHVFPSHTAQNLLRRAWSSYVDTHGADDTARSEPATTRAADSTSFSSGSSRGPSPRPGRGSSTGRRRRSRTGCCPGGR